MFKKDIFGSYIPCVRTRDLEGYFALPKKEREWHGFYRKPLALPIADLFCENTSGKGWTEWEKRIKKEYPVQWFFREYLTSYDFLPTLWIKKVGWKFDDIKTKIERFIKPCHKRFRKAYPRWSYMDLTEGIVQINFALILDFWYEEVLKDIVDWDAEENSKRFRDQLKDYVYWIENIYENLQKETSNAMRRGNKFCREGMSYKKAYEELEKLEKLISDKETEIICWMVKNRGYFWT